ncbi:MAG: tetratricopeptide repeat protein [Cryomorphaceae bacterium]
MKKLLFAVLTFATLSVQAQEAPKVTSAIIALRGNEIVEAKGFIDEATTIIDSKNPAEIKEKIMTKYYYNRALIYAQIAGSPDEAIKGLADNANSIAAESILDLLKYESTLKKPRYSEDAIREIPNIAYNYLVEAGAAYEAGDYEASYNGYMAAFDFKKNELLGEFAQLDTGLLFNAGIIAGMSGDQESSVNAFRTCLDLGYTGITYSATDVLGNPKQYPNKAAMEKDIQGGLATDPVVGEDVRPSVYISLINAYKKMENTEMYEATLTEARGLYPENKDLLDIQLQSFLDKKDYDGALANLDEAIAKNPGKGIYHFVKGNILQTELKDLDAALVEYKAALEADPENSDAMYMCGLVYIDRANKITEQMNSLSLSESRKYDSLKKKQKGVFEESLTYFENAREMNPDDLDIVRALAEVYRKVGNYEKSMEMSELLK